jgi:hypothetical protein
MSTNGEPWQGSLLDWTRPVAAPDASVQSVEQARVEGTLAEPILAWCSIHEHQQFRMDDLTQAIKAHFPWCAPDSPRKILNVLKRAGRVEVECIDRSRSLYQLGSVRK